MNMSQSYLSLRRCFKTCVLYSVNSASYGILLNEPPPTKRITYLGIDIDVNEILFQYHLVNCKKVARSANRLAVEGILPKVHFNLSWASFYTFKNVFNLLVLHYSYSGFYSVIVLMKENFI